MAVITISEDVWQRLVVLARRCGCPVKMLTEAALCEYLNRVADEWRGFAKDPTLYQVWEGLWEAMSPEQQRERGDLRPPPRR